MTNQFVFKIYFNKVTFELFFLLNSLVVPSLFVYFKSYIILPRLLQSWTTALNVSMEKSILQSIYLKSGNCILNGLCIGVKWRAASAWTPYWSSVCLGLDSHLLRVGHQRAWSDQSFLKSGKNNSTYFNSYDSNFF